MVPLLSVVSIAERSQPMLPYRLRAMARALLIAGIIGIAVTGSAHALVMPIHHSVVGTLSRCWRVGLGEQWGVDQQPDLRPARDALRALLALAVISGV